MLKSLTRMLLSGFICVVQKRFPKKSLRQLSAPFNLPLLNHRCQCAPQIFPSCWCQCAPLIFPSSSELCRCHSIGQILFVFLKLWVPDTKAFAFRMWLRLCTCGRKPGGSSLAPEAEGLFAFCSLPGARQRKGHGRQSPTLLRDVGKILHLFGAHFLHWKIGRSIFLIGLGGEWNGPFYMILLCKL